MPIGGEELSPEELRARQSKYAYTKAPVCFKPHAFLYSLTDMARVMRSGI